MIKPSLTERRFYSKYMAPIIISKSLSPLSRYMRYKMRINSKSSVSSSLSFCGINEPIGFCLGGLCLGAGGFAAGEGLGSLMRSGLPEFPL